MNMSLVTTNMLDLSAVIEPRTGSVPVGRVGTDAAPTADEFPSVRTRMSTSLVPAAGRLGAPGTSSVIGRPPPSVPTIGVRVSARPVERPRGRLDCCMREPANYYAP
jgi:hypothetical protein